MGRNAYDRAVIRIIIKATVRAETNSKPRHERAGQLFSDELSNLQAAQFGLGYRRGNLFSGSQFVPIRPQFDGTWIFYALLAKERAQQRLCAPRLSS